MYCTMQLIPALSTFWQAVTNSSPNGARLSESAVWRIFLWHTKIQQGKRLYRIYEQALLWIKNTIIHCWYIQCCLYGINTGQLQQQSHGTQGTVHSSTWQKQSHSAQCSPMYYSTSHMMHNAVQCTTRAVTRCTMQWNTSLYTAPITFYTCSFCTSSLLLFFREACNYSKVIWNYKAQTTWAVKQCTIN
jgi:hypothetical protein